MDFMFEDEVDEVGSDVEAYCPKCKADTTHVVISKYEDEIRRVQCNPCGDVHSYRKPRGEVEEDVPEPIAAKKRAMMKKLTWEEFFAKHGEKHGKPYEFRETYSENIVVTHPKFGRGFVSEILSDSKVEITFKDGRRVLVHNRRDMPGLPLAAEGDGIPSTGAKAKAAKKAAAAAAAAAAAPADKPQVVPAKAHDKERDSERPGVKGAAPTAAKGDRKTEKQPEKKPDKATDRPGGDRTGGEKAPPAKAAAKAIAPTKGAKSTAKPSSGVSGGAKKVATRKPAPKAAAAAAKKKKKK